MNERSLDDYTVVLRPDDNGTVVAYVPAIPGCHAWGRIPAKAHSELENVFVMIKEEHAEGNRSLPHDVKLTVSHVG